MQTDNRTITKQQDPRIEPELALLLDLYEARPDLKESFPEARTGHYQRLIKWAAGASRGEWKDSSYSSLQRHSEWYLARAGRTAKGQMDLTAAFKTWNRADESLAAVEKRIHDGVPVDRLNERAIGYVRTLSSKFPWAMPAKNEVVLEVGSGVAYIIEAMCRKFNPSRIIGLDIAPAMIEKARERLSRDQVSIPAEFLAYDGITIPLPAESVDYIYSVATLQHIPKPYVYNLFGEMLRIMRVGGTATLHFLAFSILKQRRGTFDFKLEIAQQLAGADGHWHHLYSSEEIEYVLTYGYGAQKVAVTESEGSLWAAFAK